MHSRLLKQFAYGLFFVLILAIFVLIIYFLFLKPVPSCFDGLQNQNEIGIDCGGNCAPCEEKYAQPIEILSLKSFPDGSGKSVLIAEVKNPNVDSAVSDFIYSFKIYDITANKVDSVSSHSFIYAGETKYLFALIDLPSLELFKKELVFSDYVWEPASQFLKPDVQIKDYRTETSKQNSLSPVVVAGVVKNADIFNLSKISVNAIIFSKSGEIIGVSKTEVENISPSEETVFQIVFPKNIAINDIALEKTKVFIEVKK